MMSCLLLVIGLDGGVPMMRLVMAFVSAPSAVTVTSALGRGDGCVDSVVFVGSVAFVSSVAFVVSVAVVSGVFVVSVFVVPGFVASLVSSIFVGGEFVTVELSDPLPV